jgi:hypothetical protein
LAAVSCPCFWGGNRIEKPSQTANISDIAIIRFLFSDEFMTRKTPVYDKS